MPAKRAFSSVFKSQVLLFARKGPLRGHILAPPEGLRGPGVPGVNPGVDPRSQGVILRRFKQKSTSHIGRMDRQT